MRESLDGAVPISAHFKLKKRTLHGVGCRLGHDELASEMGADSSPFSVRRLKESATPCVRLSILHNADVPSDVVSGPPRSGTSRKDDPNRPTLDPYVNSLVKLVELALVLGQDVALSRRTRVAYRRMSIPWAEFFFTVDSLTAAHDLVQAGCRHPLMVMAPVKDVRGKYVNLESARVQEGTTGSASLRVDAGRLASTVRTGALVAAYGLWKPRGSRPWNRVTFLNFDLVVVRPEQLLVVMPAID